MRVPIFSTIVVVAAAATMIALGVWQLRRADEKAALLAHYDSAIRMSSNVTFPRDPADIQQALYRHSVVTCDRVVARRTTPGRSEGGKTGLAQMVRCAMQGGGEAEIALGWSLAPEPAKWDGGEVAGFIGPAGKEARLIASPPMAGLQPLAPPDPKDIPNNHLAYAGQWFFFALTALAIYILALRRRRKNA
ncbi:SURF1 family cytochrome oxidase biogenesis protein [Qipengyuania marisflavi]|uniref:SURF1-like protein n=1 Tax=Qipengyuania marisflavi TaxID=2486356 RepID=A0A5S3PCI5_9SPHN|nr:SURF1 family cytochrome oxidase biogenesis protein [Qipengyuania marisflavi]TMM48959.1 SURF1 family protein [Qipengyuania marisflavi]